MFVAANLLNSHSLFVDSQEEDLDLIKIKGKVDKDVYESMAELEDDILALARSADGGSDEARLLTGNFSDKMGFWRADEAERVRRQTEARTTANKYGAPINVIIRRPGNGAGPGR